MKSHQLKQNVLLVVLVLMLLNATGCTDEFYLLEKETKAYQSVLATQTDANRHFDTLQGRIVNLQFDSSGTTPRLLSSNLLAEMRLTEMAQLETGPAAISLDRLRAELEKQIDNWVAGRLRLYTGSNNEQARLTRLDSASVQFLTNPTFTYDPGKQSIAFDASVTITLNGTIEVTALDWFLNLFVGVNGMYPLTIVLNDMRLAGEASILSPFADTGRIKFQLTPQITGAIDVLENGTSIPNQVKNGVRELLRKNLSSHVDEIFYQKYNYFTLTSIRLNNSGSLEVAYRSRRDLFGPDSTNPTLHLVARASDGKFYHARKGVSGWSGYTAIPFPSPSPQPAITNDPALFHSGSDQLELAAVNANNALVYAHWRDEAWGNQQIFNPGGSSPSTGYRGKPAIAATAPGQAEIIVKDGNGNLWHLRRVNGVWLTPAIVPLSGYSVSPPPYRDPVVLHVGNKIVVVFVNGQNRPTAIAFDLETSIWGQPTSLFTQTTTVYPLAAVASGDSRVDVVYVGANGTPYHRVLDVSANNIVAGIGSTRIAIVGAEVNLSVPLNIALNAAPVLVASGYKELELIGRGLDNRLWHNRFVNAPAPFIVDGRTVNPGWQDWQGWVSGMRDNLFGTRITTDGKVSGFAAAATRTGRTEIVMRGYTINTYTLFHNNYESARYGRTPWKTVHWRGYDSIGERLFLGCPALVAIDRNFEMAFISNSLGRANLHSPHLGEINSTTFPLFPNPTVRTSSNAIDPIVLSSGPGMIDSIVMRDDGKPEHLRHNSAVSATLTIPSGITLTKMSAVSYGNGFIELVALANDNKLYRWRYRNQTWSGPILLGSGIISAPALLHVGAGQLELLAVDFDYKLLRWRFVGNGWTSPIIIPASFRVDNLLFGQSSVSSWGDGSVDVVVVNKDTQELNHRRVGPGDETCNSPLPFACPAPRVFANLGGRIWEDPVLTAFSPTKLNVLAMQGLKWYSIWASKHPNQWITVPAPRDPRLLWSGFEYIGGDEMVVSGAAHSGNKNFAAVAIRDGRIYVNRNQDGRWTGFQSVIGQTPQMQLRLPIILPAIAAHGG
jgi:hypothetical protein